MANAELVQCLVASDGLSNSLPRGLLWCFYPFHDEEPCGGSKIVPITTWTACLVHKVVKGGLIVMTIHTEYLLFFTLSQKLFDL